MVEYCTAGFVLMRCFLVTVEEMAGFVGVLVVDGTVEVGTELRDDNFVELDGALEVDGTAEVTCELDETSSCLMVMLLDAALDWLAEVIVDLVLLVVALDWLFDVTGADEEVLGWLVLDEEETA